MSTNKQRFSEVYAQAFVDSYPHLPAEKSKQLIENATRAACDNIRGVIIDSPAFKLAAKRLGIACNYKAFEAFFNKLEGDDQ